MKLQVKKVRENAILPTRGTKGSAGLDLCACIENPITLRAGERHIFPTGIAISVPGKEYVSFIFARSGLGVKHGISLSNGVGVIDSDYTGELLVGLINLSQEDYTIQPGERIAQVVVMPVCTFDIEQAVELKNTERGTDGFGSTGRI